MSNASDELQSVVSEIVDNNCVSLAIITVVVYDYILTCSDEIEYIWNKPWTRVSTLYVLVRYCGLCGGIIYALEGTPFIPGPTKMYVLTLRLSLTNSDDSCLRSVDVFQGNVVVILVQWTILLFIAAADLTMILRVWTIYMQSRIILGILIVLYVLELLPLFLECIKFSTTFTQITSQVLDFSYCMTDPQSTNSLGFNITVDSLQIPLAATMCLLVTAQFIRQSLQMYKTTKQWQPGRYMNLFVREGMLYFFAIFLFTFCDLLYYTANVPSTGWQAFLYILEYVPVITLSPRCILSVRALYERDGRGRCGPLRHNLDTGFGFSTTVHESSVDEIVFAPGDVERSSKEDGLEQHEEIHMRELGALDGGSGV